MNSEISHFFKKTSKRNYDEPEEHIQEACSSSSFPVGKLDDNNVVGNDSAEVNTSSTECYEVNQVVQANLIFCIHHGYSPD